MQTVKQIVNQLNPSPPSPPAPATSLPTTSRTTSDFPAGTIKSWLAHQGLECDCPVCGGLGWLRQDVKPGTPEFGEPRRCDTCAEPQRRAWLARNCGLEGSLFDVRMAATWRGGDWPETDEAERERRVQQRRVAWMALTKAKKEKVGMYTFWGDFGSGKSHALAIGVNECRDELVESYYTTLADVLDHLKRLYGLDQETSTYWQRLLDVPCLALDEITRFNATKWAQDRLFVLLDTRYRRRGSHLTLMATNDDPRQKLPASEAIGYAFSRMREGELIELRGDMRTGVASQ